MNQKLMKFLFTAYCEIAKTPQYDDLTVGIAVAETVLGETLTTEERRDVLAFAGRHTQALAGLYAEGYEEFSAVVTRLMQRDAAAAEIEKV